MAKRKKQNKVQVSIDRIHELIGSAGRDLQSFQAETRHSHATMREVISATTERVGRQNGILDQSIRQVNAGFESIRKDLQRAAEALNKHEKDINSLMGRVMSLETAVIVLTKKRKVKR